MEQVLGSGTSVPRYWRVSRNIFINIKYFLTTTIFTAVVVAAVAVGELLLDDGGLQARPDPADLSLGGETVVLQHGGGDDGVAGVHGAVTGLTALLGHAPYPSYLHLLNILTFVTELQVLNISLILIIDLL